MDYFFDKPYCKIYFDEKSKAVVIKWFGYAEGEQFQEACNQSLDLLIKKKTKFMIADNSEAKVVKVEDQNWMLSDWFPKAFKAGYRTSAVIVAKNIFREMALTNIVNQLDKEKFTVQYFDNMTDAQNWVSQQP